MAALLGLVWGAPIVARMIADVDFPFHLKTAGDFVASGRITMPHFLLQVLLGGMFASGLFSSLEQAGVVFFSALYAAAGAAICWYVARQGGGGAPGAAISIVAAVAVLMAAPILPTGDEDLFLIGYFPPNAYHNPTMVVAKPLLALTLVSAVAAVTRSGPATWRELALLAAPVVLLGFAKPNYLGCLVPALFVCAGANARGVARAPSWPRIAAVAGAAVLTLAATLLLYRLLAVGAAAGIVFAPLVVIANYADVDAATIARSLAASLAFPLVASLLWPRATWRDPAMRIAWVGTAVGLFFSYFIAEAGSRMYDGNFLWTGQMAVFVLFVAAAGFAIGQFVAAAPRVTAGPGLAVFVARGAAVATVLWLHVASGIRHVQIKVASPEWLAFWT